MLDHTTKERKVRIFRNGRSRAVRIPKEFDMEGDEVIVRQEADGSLNLKPVSQRRTPRELVEWLRGQPPLEEELSEIDDSDMLPLDDIQL